jgi:Zn-finger nucleic acid-binding protein
MTDCINGCGHMSQLTYEGVEIDICKSCAGVWLDFGELTTIVETKERTWPESIINKVLSSTGTPGVSFGEQNRNLLCPKCNAVLAPTNYQGNSGVIVNACQNDHGLWLDAGELAKIQIYMERWQDITGKGASTNEPGYEEFEKDHEGRIEGQAATGASGVEIINRYLNKIFQMMS